MKFNTEKLKFKILPLSEISKKSKEFYKQIKNRRSVRDFQKKK